MRTHLLLPAALITVAAAAAGQSISQPTYWRYSHPHAKVLAGADLAAIGGSPLGQRLKQEVESLGLRATASSQGMDFVLGASQIFISTPGDGAEGNTPVVMALQGRFDLASIRRTVTGRNGRGQDYRGVEILRPAGSDSQMQTALVSPQVVLVGDGPSIRAAIDNHLVGDASTVLSSLYTRAQELSRGHEFWFVSEASPAGIAGASLPQGPALAGVHSFEGGISFRDGLGMSFHLNAESAEAAKALGTGLQALLQLSAMSRGESRETEELLNKLRIAVAGSQVQVAVNYSRQEMDQGIEQLKAGLAGTLGETMAAAQAPGEGSQPAWTLSAREPEPAFDPDRPLVVRIYNAEGGTREVDINRK